jgi:uncharacterized protein (TIGR03067 family)
MWVIYEDWILMHAKHGGANAQHYSHQLDASKNPKQIDIRETAYNGPNVGVIKGIYVLDGDELRLCLGEKGNDRPAAFPEKPKPGEVLILQRATSGATPPKAKDAQPEKKVLTPEEAIKQMPKEDVTVKFKVASVEVTGPYTGYPVSFYIYLKDGGKFAARLVDNAFDSLQADRFKKLGIKTAEDFKGKMVRVTGRIESDAGKTLFVMSVRALANIEVVKE